LRERVRVGVRADKTERMKKPAHNQQTNSAQQFQPYIPSGKIIPEFTAKVIISGAIFGILFGAANAYLGLKAGLTVSTSIPVAVMTVAFFRFAKVFFNKGTTILENNISQTIGSASSSLASGVIFTIPALFLWGLDPSLVQMAMLAMLGGLLGILFMIPLRRFLIVQEHGKLPYPEGTACAEVLKASETGGARAGNVFLGLGIGAVYKFFIGFLHLWSDKVTTGIPGLKKAQIGIETTPALLGVGYILGFRISLIMVAGGFISWMILIPAIAYYGEGLTSPLFPETVKLITDMAPSEIWTRYIRYVGAGAVAFGGIATIIRSIPVMIKSFRLSLDEVRGRMRRGPALTAPPKIDRTQADLPLTYVAAGVGIIVLILALVPHILGPGESLPVRLVAAPCIAIFAFFFVTVSSRIVGLVGVSSNPTSGMTIMTLLGTSLIFVLLGWTDEIGMVTALTVGTVVCVAASIAGDTSQDLKTGFLVGATPNRQQIGELIGAVTSAFAVCGAVVILNSAYQFGSTDLPAPQATLMKTVIEGVLQAKIPWGFVIAGAGLGAIVELLRLPSLPFAVGLYLPVSTMTPIFVGGCIRRFIEKKYAHDQAQLNQRRERGILFGSGLIAGEGLLGVGIALYAFFLGKPGGVGHILPGALGDILSLAIFALLGYLLLRRTSG
jgi:putative OPT family oligopeptide transporter